MKHSYQKWESHERKEFWDFIHRDILRRQIMHDGPNSLIARRFARRTGYTFERTSLDKQRWP